MKLSPTTEVILFTFVCSILYILIFFADLIQFYPINDGCGHWSDPGWIVWALFLAPFLYVLPLFSARRNVSRDWFQDMFFTIIVLQLSWLFFQFTEEYLQRQLWYHYDFSDWKIRHNLERILQLSFNGLLIVIGTFLPLTFALGFESVKTSLKNFAIIGVGTVLITLCLSYVAFQEERMVLLLMVSSWLINPLLCSKEKSIANSSALVRN
jgi:hypothetical protein